MRVATLDENTKRLIDRFSSEGNLAELLHYSTRTDAEIRAYALDKLVDYYTNTKAYGQLVHLCGSERCPEEIREKAGNALIGMAKAVGPRSNQTWEYLSGREKLPVSEGILQELALRGNFPEKIREAAGIKMVELLRESAGWEFTRSKVRLEFVAKTKRYPPKVQEAALNALDALDLKEKHARDQATLGRSETNERAGGNVIPINRNRTKK